MVLPTYGLSQRRDFAGRLMSSVQFGVPVGGVALPGVGGIVVDVLGAVAVGDGAEVDVELGGDAEDVVGGGDGPCSRWSSTLKRPMSTSVKVSTDVAVLSACSSLSEPTWWALV